MPRFPSKGNLGHDASLFVVPFRVSYLLLISVLDAQLSASTRPQLTAICMKMKKFLLVLSFGACQVVLGQNITDVPICAVRQIELVASGKMVLILNSKPVWPTLPKLKPSVLESTSNVCVLTQRTLTRCLAAWQLHVRLRTSKVSLFCRSSMNQC